jgi:multiple sugar transport system permease protein
MSKQKIEKKNILPKSPSTYGSNWGYKFRHGMIEGLLALVTISVLVIVLVPFLWMILTSLKYKIDTMAFPPIIIPTRLTLDNFRQLAHIDLLALYFTNTVIVAIGSTILAVSLGSAAAYSLSRVNLPFRLNTILFTWILFTRMYPAIATVIPFYVLIRSLGLLDTRLALIITYAAFDIPLVVWLMHGFFEGIPKELEKAATVDGASLWQRFSRIILPLSAPGLIATTVLSFILAWNEFLFAVILTSVHAKTAPVVMAGFITDMGTQWGMMSAMGTLLVLPVILLAWTVQKYLIQGLTLGAVK